MIARLLAAASGKWLLIAAGALFVAMAGTIAFQRHAIQNKNDEIDQANTRLALCQQINASNAEQIERINRQAAENARAAELERVRAQQAARELAERQEAADAEHEAELDALRVALAADDCAGALAPADADRLFRETPARPN